MPHGEKGPGKGPHKNPGPPMPGGANQAGPFDHDGATWVVRAVRIYKIVLEDSDNGIFVPKAELQSKVDSIAGKIGGIDHQISQLQAEKAALEGQKTDYEALIAAANF